MSDNVHKLPDDDSPLDRFISQHSRLTPVKGGVRPTPGGFDWDSPLEAGDYDPSAFYTRSVDKSGNSYKRSIWFPGYLLNIVDEAVQQRRVPAWRTFEDYVRDSSVHRLYQAARIYDLPSRVDRQLRIERFHARVEASRMLRKQAKDAVDDFSAEIEAAERDGDKRGIRTLIRHAKEIVGHLDEPWDGRLRAKIEHYETRL